MNCTELDELVFDVQRFVSQREDGFVLSVSLLLGLSLALVLQGQTLVRPLTAIVGSVISAGVVFYVSAWSDPPIQCEVRLVGAGITALFAALLTLCILNTGLFLLGAAGMGGVAHLLYETLPLQNVDPPFTLFGRSGWYYLALVIAVIVGAVLSQLQKKNFIRVSSSLIGGGGIALATHLITERAGVKLAEVFLLLILVGCTVLGTLVQTQVANMKSKKKNRTEEEDEEGEMV